MLVSTAAICLIVGPITIIDITVYVYETAFAVSSVFAPLSAVLGPVIPNLLTEAIAEASLPLACIGGTRPKGVKWSLFSWHIGIVLILCHSLTSFFLGEILAASHLLGSNQGHELTSLITTIP